MKDLAAEFAEGLAKLAPIAEIPPSYWQALPVSSVERWDWADGHFSNSEMHKEDHWGYASVTLKEADVNTLASRLNPSDRPPNPIKERRPKALWKDWVAALAILAKDGRINGEMTQKDLLDLVTDQLHDWDLEGRENSTVGPTATAVLERFREISPVSSMS